MCKKTTMRHDYDKMAEYILTVLPVVKHDPKLLEIFKNGLRNQIFDLGEVYTGYTSRAAIATGLPKVKLTSEHIYPRNRSAIQIMNRCLNGPSISQNRLAAWLKSRCRVHITTNDENRALVPLQKDPNYFWRNGYHTIGIKLEKYDFPTKQQYVYNVAGKVYNTLHEVAEEYGMSPDAMRNRFLNTRDKWNQWTRTEK